MKFSERLKELRLEQGYTQKELAKKIGISYQSLQKYEKGIGKPRLTRLEELGVVFDVSISYLLGETDIRSASKISNTLAFSKRIKALRLEFGYTQKELAQKIGMTGAGYSKYGTGEEKTFPQVDRLLKLAEVFNVSVSYLLGETDERPLTRQEEPTNLPERLKLLRIQGGYKQIELSKKLDFASVQTYNNYEKGINKPQKENLEKIADFFDVSTEYLLYGTKDQNISKQQ